MNKHEPRKIREVAVFKSNRSQAIRIPKDFAFPEGTKKVEITRMAEGLLITASKKGNWAEYFSTPSGVSDGFEEEMMAAINAPQPPDDDVSFD